MFTSPLIANRGEIARRATRTAKAQSSPSPLAGRDQGWGTELSRKLRRMSSPPERAMWRILHPFRQEGYHFRRQVEIGTYFVDFGCHQPAIVIEIDGDTHTVHPQLTNDAVRDDYLTARGYRVLRFWNNEVFSNPDGVYALIAAALTGRVVAPAPPTLDPSPQGGGRRLPVDEAQR